MYKQESDVNFPSQKKPFSRKGSQWRKDCINAAEKMAYSNEDNAIRKSRYSKRVNFNLYSDILDESDIEKTCNPFSLNAINAPAKMQNYPICNPKIDLLVGESIKRRFDWKVRVMNEDAISKKEEDLKERFSEMLGNHLNKGASEEEMKEDLKRFQEFKQYTYQDIRERTASQILHYLYRYQKLDYKFSKGFKNALIAGEEIYQCDIIAGEPVISVLNPLNVDVVRSGESPYIEDADMIIVHGYMSPGQIIDTYHEYLSSADITRIENRFGSGDAQASHSAIDIGHKPDLAIDRSLLSFKDIETGMTNAYGSPYDNSGNIYVSKVYWKSMRKMKKVKYYDEFNDEQFELHDEHYKIDKSKGEEETIIWISEWWEGHKIGGVRGSEDDEAIYVRMQPKEVQFRSLENPSKCSPGIIGTIYNTNDNESVSLMDRMKPYQYLYNVLAYNTELMVAKNIGKIQRLDLSEVPEGWEIDKWLSFAFSTNIAVYDSFKEGNKGSAQGKLAGSMNKMSPVIDMQMGDSIQMYIGMMQHIKSEIGEISGVSNARQGQISSREAVGNVEREVTQSSHITEYWFMEHDFCKMRVLECLLETAKFAWKDKSNKKVQYVLDDASTTMLNIDMNQFNECEYGVLITDGVSSHELLNVMKQLAHAGIQNGILKYSELIDIYNTTSIASKKRKFQKSEMEREEQGRKQQEAERNMKKEIEQMRIEREREREEFEKEKLDREDARHSLEQTVKLAIHNDQKDFHKDGGEDIKLEELKLKAEKMKNEYLLKKKEHDETVRHNKAEEDIAKAKHKLNSKE